MDLEDDAFREAENDTIDIVDLANVPSEYVAEESILIFFGLLGISANILMIYIICYYRKLHTNTNTYLVNWAIADSGSGLITITCFRVFYFIFEVPDEILCFYIGLGFALLFNEMLFMILLTVDWCLSSYLPRPLDKFRECTRYIVAAAWILSVVYAITSSFLCTSVSRFYLIFHISLPIVFSLLLVFVVVLHGARIVQKLRKKFEYHLVSMLLVPTAFVLCWFLSWANLLFMNLPYMASETPVFLHPTINLLLLVILNEDFKTCFMQTVRCKPSCNLFKRNTDRNGSVSNNGELSFDNRTFDQVNRHV